MPSDKAKVTSYLGDEEKAVFDKLCKKNGFSNSEGVAHLIRTGLMKQEEATVVDEKKVKLLAKSIMPLEQIEKTSVQTRRQCEKIEKLEELLSKTQEDILRLQKQLADATPDYFLDEEIASVTGCREQQVYEWRMGLRKPRGERILHKLEPYEIKDGRWVKKRMCEG